MHSVQTMNYGGHSLRVVLTTFSYLVNFQSLTKLPYFSKLTSDYNTDFLIALEHHYVSFQPHHTCHIIILAMSLLPLSFLCLSLSLPCLHHVFGYPFVIHWTPLTSMTITFNLYHILYKSLFFLSELCSAQYVPILIN